MSDMVTIAVNGRIAVASIDNPPVNAASHGVRAGLVAAMDRLEQDDALDALVLICAGKSFVSGADIKEFGRPLLDPQLAAVTTRFEGSAKPVIAAIHGKALGGGLEIALACHYRVAAAGSAVGLPEVKLGIIPGCGGTQRLPRLTGLAPALAMTTEGNEMPAARALELGLLDEVAQGDLRTAAIVFAEKVVSEKRGIRRVRDLPMPPKDDALIAETRATLARKKRGHLAPQAAIDAIEAAYALPFDEALDKEYAICRELLAGPQSRALRHNFASERIVTKIAGLPAGTGERPIGKVAVVGLGVMGTGIAIAFANAGLPVITIARSAEKLDKGMATIAKSYAGLVKRGTLTQEKADARIALITPTIDLGTLADVDLVVESASEERDAKIRLFAELGAATRPGTILASNTSYIDIDLLADASGRPADVCGMHFFNPANVMRLLENVATQRTAPDVIATITAVGRKIGKLPILSGVCEGFIVNRMLAKRSREGFFMLEEGAKPAQIDKVLTGFGFPMGPYALGDLAGIDVQYAARQARLAGFSEREKAANFVDQLYAQGRYGQKTGAGWYRYGEDRKPQHDPAIDAMLEAHAQARGIAPRVIEDREILERCIYAMVNEGAKILDEGIATRPDDIDVAMINGLGFPAITGGPLWWAGEIGLAKVRDAMLRYADIAGAEYWTPSPLIDRLAASGKTFYDA
ncbi:3-hydroxyacyl-CoA dehydrogenase [Sphingomonas laterariae]|uniref:3-hydroxyacyl-CoA dehydrogenase n=1 Tax=Edaphosphingomonas laterariae TaxID=861865 RepID=A0A239H3C9_9SPHN|nr:3-hydroxyacyl-CoA dehydrogenase NAD-binding domain-containing protein [Sphingomonas laterariae]SNS75692.1 3-hydroxyacyl-CoA dehydrogenase [Sphingomonas laterariae]